MSPVRLVADDLTGALDAGAQFTQTHGPLVCSLGPMREWPDGQALAVNLGCRDGSPADAIAATEAALPILRGAGIGFKKIDSLLRGHWAAELAVCVRSGLFGTIVLAPAFPAQNRATRGGRQWVRFPGQDWRMVDVDTRAALAAEGVPCRRLAASTDLPRASARGSVMVCDAETEDDLDRIAAVARGLPGPVLWCGSAGLARALSGVPPRPAPFGARPHLAIVGTNNPVSLGQIAHLRRIAPDLLQPFDHAARAGAARIAAVLDKTGACLATADLPSTVDRGDAAALIATWLGDVFGRLAAPACLTIGGGETFLALCRGLAVDHLELLGEHAPGLPISRLVGGVWSGTTVLSKSGAFGDEALFSRLLAGAA
jgi:uncharacterized protein YgbK (DUF1537 family)